MIRSSHFDIIPHVQQGNEVLFKRSHRPAEGQVRRINYSLSICTKMVKLCRGKRFQTQSTASPPSLSRRHCERGETAGMSLTSQLEQAEIYPLCVEMCHLSLSHKKNDLSCQRGIGTCGCSPSFRIFLFPLSTPGGGCQLHCQMLIPVLKINSDSLDSFSARKGGKAAP